MKILFGTLILFFIYSFSFNKPKAFKPPGTVKISDTLFADECEISNSAWQEYEKWIMVAYGKNSTEHNAAKPDTLVWLEKTAYNQPYVKYYYQHPAYKDYPVVGISYEQALAYCKWRTARVKDFLTKAKKYNNPHFEYRLPTKQEWEMLTWGGRMEFNNNGKNEKGQMKMNVMKSATDAMDIDNADITAPIYSYWKNFFGLYNLIGNVAEMVNEKGISKGGSWKNTLEDCRIGKDIQYSKPQAWLGFRCVCVIKNE